MSELGDIIRKDTDRVGLSEEGRLALEELEGDGFLKDKLSGYRLAISVAIEKSLDISQHVVNRPAGHMYLQSQLDPEGVFSRVIDEIYPELQHEKYRTLEKLADLGIIHLNKEALKTGSLVIWE